MKRSAQIIDYTVLANFAPVKSVERTNEWTLSVAREYSGLIPLISEKYHSGCGIGKAEITAVKNTLLMNAARETLGQANKKASEALSLFR